MRLRATILGTAMLIAGGTTGAPPAGANSTPAGDFTFSFSSSRPGAAAGLEFRQLYKNSKDAKAKPSPVRRFLFAAPEGSVFDGSAVPACKASDQQFQMLGRAACPPGSVVGTGFITVMTGLPGEAPFRADATVFNSGDGIIELFTLPGSGTFLAMERPKFRGRSAFEDTDVAPTPGGPPDGQSAAREAYLKFPRLRGPSGRSFITTPVICPAGGRWTARFEWANADGTSHRNMHDMRCHSGSTAADSACLARRVSIGGRNIGRLRLRQTRARTLRRTRTRGSVSRHLRVLRYCVKGPDRRARAVAVFDRRHRLRVALTDARGHKRRGIGRGSSLQALRRRFGSRMRELGTGLWIVRGESRDDAVVVKVVRSRVRYVALADRGLAGRPALLRRFLRQGEA